MVHGWAGLRDQTGNVGGSQGNWAVHEKGWAVGKNSPQRSRAGKVDRPCTWQGPETGLSAEGKSGILASPQRLSRRGGGTGLSMERARLSDRTAHEGDRPEGKKIMWRVRKEEQDSPRK